MMTTDELMQKLADENLALKNRIKRAIAAAEQPHYGDTEAKIDHYWEALCILKGDDQ
jgi:hypothetical protein